MASEKKLYKKTSEKKICGVCAGLAEYLNMDVTVVRLLFVLLSLHYGIPGDSCLCHNGTCYAR